MSKNTSSSLYVQSTVLEVDIADTLQKIFQFKIMGSLKD